MTTTNESIKTSPEICLLERLAELEHLQWVNWSKQIAKTENISSSRLERWVKLWATPYSELSEEDKEKDRELARKVLGIMDFPKRIDLAAAYSALDFAWKSKWFEDEALSTSIKEVNDWIERTIWL